MKIAIKGHPTRGKEVIQLLESLGGQNIHAYWGHSGNSMYYYINKHCKIVYDSIHLLSLYDYKLYTLEEFEKEFPFKIGDIVLLKGVNKPYEVIALELYMDKLCYKLDSGLHYAPETLTAYKEMKEERNITLTLEKAKEWYKKGGELKEIALQAFTEKELNPLPRSWEEFCENYPVKKGECIIESEDRISVSPWAINVRRLKTWIPSKKSAEAHLALIQLEQLRNCWWNGWEPIWDCSEKWCIRLWGNELTIGTTKNISRFLTFPTKEMAEEFLKCFRDLIEKAGDLI